MHYQGGVAAIFATLLLAIASEGNLEFDLSAHQAKTGCENQDQETLDKYEKVQAAFCDHKVQCALDKYNALKSECDSRVDVLAKMCEERLSFSTRERILEQKMCDLQVMDALRRCPKEGVNRDSRLSLLKLSTGLYYISDPTLKANWHMAGHFCESNGLELVSIETEEENVAILESIRAGGTDYFWTSGTDLGSEGTFYWSATGKQIGPFTNYSVGQPDNYNGDEHCLILWKYAPNKNYAWNDIPCKSAMRFICEL